jgi:hypothetical protein
MGWVFIVVGFVVLLLANLRGAYRKNRLPGNQSRVSFTIAGIGLVFIGTHYLRVSGIKCAGIGRRFKYSL